LLDLEKYIKAFKTLRVDSAHAKQLGRTAPHKPILLLSVIDSIENGEISTNKVFITSELVGIFRANWACLVQENYRPEIALPFYHLKNEKDRYWRLIPKSGYERLTDLKIRSFPLLVEVVEYAEIDRELFSLMSDESTRHVLRSVLLDTYFLSKSYGL
jgi:putative restriction endonuclease